MNRRGEEGVALMLALLFVVLLATIVVEYAYEMQVEAAFVEGNLTDLEAHIAAKSAVASGLALLAADIEEEEMSESETAEGPVDSLQDIWATGVPYQAINDAVLRCSIDDECGKLNLGILLTQDTNEPDEVLVETLRALFRAREVEEDPVDAILDWVDSDDDTRDTGAESDYYASLELPYGCKNARLDSAEELLLIRGITPEVFYGNPDQGQLPLSELLSVFGHAKVKINVNTAEREVLEALGEALNGQSGFAETIIEERESSPFTSVQDLQNRGIVIPKQKPVDQPQQPQQEPPHTRTQTLRPRQDRTPLAKAQVTFRPQRRDITAPRADPDEDQGPLDVWSSVFRLYGDGLCGEAQVRIEVYVLRGSADADEAFRILDWRVIR